MGQRRKRPGGQDDDAGRDGAPARREPRAEQEKVTSGILFVVPDGTKHEWIPGQEDRLPPDVLEAINRKRSAVISKLIEILESRDEAFREAIRLYRLLSDEQRETPEGKELNGLIADAIRALLKG